MNILEKYATMEYGPSPEARNEADAWLAQRNFGEALFIDGSWRAPVSAEAFEVIEPATGLTIANVASAGAEDVAAAVAAAQRAQAAWGATSGFERARVLYALGRMLQRNARLFAVLESINNGKPIRESRDIDVPLAVRHFLYHAGWAQAMEREFPGYKPVGVVGQIIPWNFPLLMLAWKIAPALAAGCTVILKPAEFTPLTAILFAEMCERCGVPKGVVNILPGGPEAGAAIVRHPDIAKIAFTGSSEVGKLIRKETAGSGKKLSLELGGKSPFIVLEDADLDSAVEGLVDGIWFNQGQVCCAGSRLLMHESIAEKFIAKTKARMAQMRVGSPLDKNTDIGAIVASVQIERIRELVAEGEKQGAVCWQPDCALPSSGLFYPPTLVTNVSPANILVQEEIFGPVLVAMTFRTIDEAIELANNSRYGLAASVWSENMNAALHVAPQLKAGVVWLNGTNMFDASCSFGGYRESGFGREGGREGLQEYLVPQSSSKPLYRPLPELEAVEGDEGESLGIIDRTHKLYIGGKQVRPDGNYSMRVADSAGRFAGEVGLGSRKDIRDAVTVARACHSWSETTAYNRSQVLYFLAENLSSRAVEFANRLQQLTGMTAEAATNEVELSIKCIFAYAGWADKFEGRVHSPPMRGVAIAMNEPVGTIGIVAPDDTPLLGFVSMIAPALAMGNRVIAVPSARYPLVATDLFQVLNISDLPAGSINIVTGRSAELALVLARHDDVDGLWCVAESEICRTVEAESAGNIKRVWTNAGLVIDWQAEGAHEDVWLRRATEVKNVWIPYGE
ncbi:aldehyde dehydrogenase family protein [Microvirga sp. 2MCAF38]|uniref:aldehyde dehydrogenase family protein n=1 Tax=Microvirga sp. 2MCAF38 TaxID=3232989 RepID=UPI003F970EBF